MLVSRTAHGSGTIVRVMAENGGLTPSMATLAVFARASNTLAGAQAELSAWPGGRWHRNTAHKHVPALVEKGHLRLVGLGKVDSLNRYEITEEGEAHRRSRLYASAAGPAAVERERALAKLELCKTPADVLVVIDSYKAEEELFERAYAEAHARGVRARRARMRSTKPADDLSLPLQAGLRDIGIRGEARLWSEMADRLRWMRRETETLLAELK